MKIVLISDLHFGVRKGSKVFLDSQMRYFNEELIPMIKDQGYKDLWILGDIWDNRESLNAKCQNEVYHMFETLANLNINVKLIVGNHDTQYKTNIEVHSLKYLSLFPNVEVIDRIKEETVEGLDVTFFPWQTDDLFTQTSYKGEIAFGHFDINGCMLNKTTVQEGGTGQSFFYNNFKRTYSGHFHTQSYYSHPNGSDITYIGSPYHLNRNDIDTEKGCIIFDTDTLKHERVNSTTPLQYIKTWYPSPVDEIPIKNNIIDVHVKISDKFKSNKLTDYIYSIENHVDGEPINVNIVPHYDSELLSSENIDDDLSKVKSIPQMIKNKLSTMDLGVEYAKSVNEYITDIYSACQEDD